MPGGTSSGLERFASDAMTTPLAAQDAIVRLDGVEVTRATNSFSDLIAGVQIDLKSAKPDVPVSVGVSRPVAAISQGVQDFVAAYNELLGMIAEQTRVFTKQAGESNYGSRGPSLNLKLELDSGLIGDPDRLKERRYRKFA